MQSEHLNEHGQTNPNLQAVQTPQDAALAAVMAERALPPLRFPWWAWLPVGLLGFVCYGALLAAKYSPAMISEVIEKGGSVLLVSALAFCCLHKLPRAKAKLGVLGVILFTLFQTVQLLAWVGRSVREQDAMAGVQQQLEQHKRAELEQFERGEFVDPSKRLDSAAKVYDDASKQMAGEDRLIMEELATLMRARTTMTNELKAAFDAFLEAGGLDVRTIPNRASLDARIAMLEHAQSENAKLEAEIYGLPDVIAQHMRAKGVSEASVQDLLQGAKQGLEGQREVRVHQRKSFAASLKMFRLLQEHWGTWTVQQDTGVVEFQSDEQLTQFNALAEELNEYEAAMQAILEQRAGKPGGQSAAR